MNHPNIKTNFPLDQHKRRYEKDENSFQYVGEPVLAAKYGVEFEKSCRVGSRNLLKAIANSHAKNAKDIPTRRSWEMVVTRA